jgi:hypothetical protein
MSIDLIEKAKRMIGRVRFPEVHSRPPEALEDELREARKEHASSIEAKNKVLREFRAIEGALRR